MRNELLTGLANPKGLLLLTAFLPQFVDDARPVAGQLLVLGVLYVAIELVGAAAWAAAGQRARVLGARMTQRLDRIVGGVFLALAGLLATTRR